MRNTEPIPDAEEVVAFVRRSQGWRTVRQGGPLGEIARAWLTSEELKPLGIRQPEHMPLPGGPQPGGHHPNRAERRREAARARLLARR